MKRHLIILAFAITFPFFSQSQDGKSIKYYGHFQIWTRYTALNPGSQMNGSTESNFWDVSIRRYRLGVRGSVNEKLRYSIQLGNNNLNYQSKDIAPKLLDAYLDYDISKNITLALGKHPWTGLSRYAAPSTFSALSTDINYSATPFLNSQDDFFRKLGASLHGQFGKIDYRVVVAKPFIAPTATLGSRAQFYNDPQAVHTSGYVKYQFRDKEAQINAFSPWTYHGKKQIFNIGAGYLFQSASTAALSSSGDTILYNAVSYAADIFYEKTRSSGNTWTLYGSLIHHNLGKDFIKNIGANDPTNGSGTVAFNGKGNAFPTTGTGNILFGYVAFHRPVTTANGSKIGLQPYLMVEYGMFDALDEPMTWYDCGVSYLIDSHNNKITLGYQNRPIYTQNGDHLNISDHKGMVTLQYEIKFQ